MNTHTAIQYPRGATRPELALWLYDSNKQLIDFSVPGYSFVVRIGDLGKPALMEKTTDIIGAAGSGNEDTPGSVPNLKVQWVDDDLDIAIGEYTLQVNADAGGGDMPRYFFRYIEILDIVLAPLP